MIMADYTDIAVTLTDFGSDNLRTEAIKLAGEIAENATEGIRAVAERRPGNFSAE